MRSVTYCSFADPGKCLGIVILEGNIGVIEAARKAHRLNINPGGEVVAVFCKESDNDIPKEIFEAMWNNQNRLIPVEFAQLLGDAFYDEPFAATKASSSAAQKAYIATWTHAFELQKELLDRERKYNTMLLMVNELLEDIDSLLSAFDKEERA